MTKPNVTILSAVTLIVALVTPCCAPSKQLDDVIVIVVDTWRHDYPQLLRESGSFQTPFLDQLAAESVVFQRCRSHSSNTNLAMSVLWTGLLPSQTGVLTQMSPLAQRFETVAEVYQNQGYETIGFCANPVLQPKKGFAQGFDQYHMTDMTGDRVLAELSAHFEEKPKSKKPMFLYVHLMDCHFPYYGADCLEQAGIDRLDLFDRVHAGEGSVEDILFGDGLTDADIELGRLQYQASICQTDTYLNAMADLLGELWQNARIVITADHGESLGEHDYYFGHSLLTYDVSLRVPLLLRMNGQGARRDDQWVDHRDLYDTLVDWAHGLPGILLGDAQDLNGVHQAWGHPNLRQFRSNTLVPRPGRSGARRSAAVGAEKLIAVPQRDGSVRLEYYRVDEDPYERRNLGTEALTRSDHADELLAAVGDEVDVDSVDLPMDEAERERLRSLGYLGN